MKVLTGSVTTIAALVLTATITGLADGAPATFSQLISTRYARDEALPPDYRAPSHDLTFVDAKLLPQGVRILSAAHTKGGAVWVMTDRGAYRLRGRTYVPVKVPRTYVPLQPMINPDLEVTCVADDGGDHILAGTTLGLLLTDGADWWRVTDRRDGMPYDDLTCIHQAANGDIWGGTSEGAWRMRRGSFRYFWGRRWLPGNRVSAIWTDAKGRAWLDTDHGIACIEETATTLAAKAAHFDSITQERHNRRGYICDIRLKAAGDPSKGIRFHAADNDGLWTSYYVAAMSLRYAATHDAVALKEARQSMNAVLDLERLTGIPGFPARSVVTDEEVREHIDGFDPDSVGSVPGETIKQWFRSPVDPHTWCKGDTSSDELDGHYMAWYLYSEFVADPAEKAKIAATARRVTDRILANNYTLVGHTGHPTRWGIWTPEALNGDPDWSGERGLNSIEMLSHLKVAEHLTGDPRYAAAYNELVDRQHFLLNTLEFRRAAALEWESLNHSDDQLAYMAYYPLLMLERDPLRRRILTQSVARTWEPSNSGEMTLKSERSAFYNFAYGAMTGNPCSVEDAVANLEEWPWELIEWTVKNAQRHDVRFLSRSGSDGRNRAQLDRVLSAAERPVERWNGSPWSADGGSNGRGENDGSAWLIGYWLGVYHGYIPVDR